MTPRRSLVFGTLLLACGASPSTIGPDAAAGRDADLSPPPPTPDPPLPPGATPLYRSGTRLRAVVYRAEDGTTLFGGFHDSKLDFSCPYSSLLEGDSRCAPTAGWVGSNVVYSDAMCRTPVLAANNGIPSACEALGPPSFAIETKPAPASATSCLPPSRFLYRVGQMVSLPAAYRMASSSTAPTTCSRMNGPVSTTMGYSLTRVPADELVAIGYKTEARGAALISFSVSEDGGIGTLPGFESLDSSNYCSPESGSPTGRLRCGRGLVLRRAEEVEFADATCSSPVLSPPTPPCGREITSLSLESPVPGSGYWPSFPTGPNAPPPQACRTTLRTFQVKGPFGGAGVEAPRYKLVDGVCREHSRTPVTGYTVFVEGDLPPPEPVRTLMVGTGRLRLPTAVNAKGEKLATGSRFFDLQRNEPCTPTRLRESLRCLPFPGDNSFDRAYTDAECTKMVLLARGPDCLNRDSSRYYWYDFESTFGVCAGLEHQRLFERGRVITPGELFERVTMSPGPGPCVPRRIPTAPSAVYETTELFPEDFAPLERVVE